MSYMNHTSIEAAQNAAKLEDTLQTMGLTTQGVMDEPDDLFTLLEKGTISPSQMNDLAMMMGDNGNEVFAAIMQERLRATGGSGGLLQGFGDMVNQSVAARSGSLTVDIGGRVSNTVTADTDPEPRDFVAELQLKIDTALDANGMTAADVPENQDVVAQMLGTESDTADTTQDAGAEIAEAVADATLAAGPTGGISGGAAPITRLGPK